MKKYLPKTTKNKVQKKLQIVLCLTLVMFFVICVAEFYNIIAEVTSKYKKTYPELEIMPKYNETMKSVLIVYDENKVETVDKWIYLIDEFLEAYTTILETQDVALSCDFEHLPRNGQVCAVDLDNFGPCIPPYYGYYTVSPCVFLKLSKIHTWIPDCYSSTDKLPPTMPKDLVDYIKLTGAGSHGNGVWVSCEGEDDIDKEQVHSFNYYPSRSFPSYFFPLKYPLNNQLSPLIAVEIVNPQPGIIINIECRLWAKNIRRGSAHFEFMRDEFKYNEADEWQ